MKSRSWLLLAVLIPTALAAQSPARVSGRVVDALSGEPVAYAEVRLDDAHRTTGDDGQFHFDAVNPGRRALSARRIGFAPRDQFIEVLPGIEETVILRLDPLAVPIESLAVVAVQDEGITIQGAELSHRGTDLGQALDGWEGVVVRRTGSGGPAAPQVRGSAPDEVLVLVDGFPINDAFTGRADLSRIGTRDVARVTLLPGAQTVRAGGRAIAGVIMIATRRVFAPELGLRLGSHRAGSGRLGAGRGAASVSLTGERFADAFPYDIPPVRGGGGGIRDNAGGTLWTLNGRVRGTVDLVVLGSRSTRGVPGITTNPTRTARAEDASALVGASHQGRLSWQSSVEWLETRASDPTPNVGLPYDSRTNGLAGSAALGLSRDLTWAGATGEVHTGADFRYDRFWGSGVQDGAAFHREGLSAGGSIRWGARQEWRLVPAVRIDMWKDRTRPFASGRLDAEYSRGNTTLSAALGSAVTAPALANLLFREGEGVLLNPDLRPERTRWEIEAGVRHTGRWLGAGGHAALRLYYGRVADMVLWYQRPAFNFVWSPGNFDVRRRGGEVTLDLEPAKTLRLDGSATLSAVTYDHTGGAQVAYRPRTTITAGLTWTPGPWETDLRWHRIGTRYRDNSGVNRLAPISLWDAGIERRLGASLSTRFEVHDLLDRRSEFIAGYPTPGRTFSLSLNLVLQ